jgi:hypothetical protein
MASEDLIGLVIFLLFIGVAFSPVLLFFCYVFFQNFKRKGIYQKLSAANQSLAPNSRVHFVRYATQAKYDSWLKIFPWNGAGVMYCQRGRVLFAGQLLSGSPLQMEFNIQNSRASWEGLDPLKNGVVSWVFFETANGRQYFTSETGPFVFGSKKSTERLSSIFKIITKN